MAHRSSSRVSGFIGAYAPGWSPDIEGRLSLSIPRAANISWGETNSVSPSKRRPVLADRSPSSAWDIPQSINVGWQGVIRGIVNVADEPVIQLTLILRNRQKRFPAVIDTGFNGYLSVPRSIIEQSGWYHAGYETYEIATGELVRRPVYIGELIFDRKRCSTYLVASQAKDILVGTRLLQDKRLEIDFCSRRVFIRP